METQGTIDLYLYWDRIRGDKPAPPRNRVEPSDIRKILPYTFILQNDECQRVSFRLAGTRLCATMGDELRGQPFANLFRERDHKLIARLTENCRRDHMAISLGLTGKTLRKRLVNFDMILLPLAQEDGFGLVIGVVQASGFGQWFGRDHIGQFEINSLRLIDPSQESALLKQKLELNVPNLVPNVDDPVVINSAKPGPFTTSSGISLRVINGGKNV